MKIQRKIKKRIRKTVDGVDVEISANAAIAGNIGGGRGSTAHASATSHQPVHQESKHKRA